jgi:hypothetical protein
MQLDPGVGGHEPPFDPHLPLVPVDLPGGHPPAELPDRTDPPVQALFRTRCTSGGPDAPMAPIIFWTRAFGPTPIGVPESRTSPWTAKSTLIWEIPVDRGTHP